MRRLMLLRHAKTENDAPSGRDQDRRLDDRGRKDAAEIGGWIASHPPFPDCVLVSPAIRAHQTWEIAWAAMKDRCRAAGGTAAGTLRRRSGATAANHPRRRREPIRKRLMVVGHNPGMHELALALTGGGDAAGTQGAGRQSADLGPCDIRLCDRRLGRCGIPPRTARAVRQPEIAEAGFATTKSAGRR